MYEPEFICATPYRYYQNGLDVTWYIMHNMAPPMSERFFEVVCR